MSDYIKVKDLFPITNGIFAHVDYDFFPINTIKLDLLFISNYGERSISPVASRLVEGSVPTDNELIAVGSMLKAFYSVKWDKLKSLYLLEYDPIHNYMDELTETITDVDTGKAEKITTSVTTNNQNGTSKNTRTDNLTEKQDLKSDTKDTNSSEDSVYGFNSSSAVKAESDSESLNNSVVSTATKNNTGSQINDGVKTNITNETINHNNKVTSDDTNLHTRTSKHSGNIGNLTTQQMFKQEIEIRQWNFINSVLEDVKEFLTLPIYM